MHTARLALLLLSCFAAPASAETKLERVWPSPPAAVSLTIGTTDVAIEYHRPGVKGRAIWGALVPYGEVWRTGANEATTLRLEHAARIDGHDVPAGTYAFFAIPEKDRWTLILNRKAQQWGHYAYKAEEDQLRWTVVPKEAPHTEWLAYTIDPVDADSALVRLRWEKLEIPLTIDVDVSAIVLAEIDRRIAEAQPGDWELYLQAARHYHDTDHELPRALEWVDKSIAAKRSFWNLELKARLLDKTKRTAEALPLLEEAIPLARAGGAPKGYVDGLEKLLAEYRAKG